MLEWIENRLLVSGFKYSAHSCFPVYKLSRENTQAENMCDIVFEKIQDRAGKVNRTSAYADAAVRRVLSKRLYEKFPRIYKKSSVPESLF